MPSATERCRSEAGGMCCVSGRVRCTNGQGQAPHMGANGTNMAFLIVFTLAGNRSAEFPARGGVCWCRRIFTYISWWDPASKNLLILEARYPALRCHILNKTQVTRTTHTTQEPPHHRTHEQKHTTKHLAEDTSPHRLEIIPLRIISIKCNLL